MTTPAATAPAGQVHTATPVEAKRVDMHHAVIYDATGMVLAKMAPSEHAWERAQELATAVNTHSQLLAQNAALRAAIDSALEYFEDREDVVDGSYGESAPNKEMALAQELRTAIGVSP